MLRKPRPTTERSLADAEQRSATAAKIAEFLSLSRDYAAISDSMLDLLGKPAKGDMGFWKRVGKWLADEDRVRVRATPPVVMSEGPSTFGTHWVRESRVLKGATILSRVDGPTTLYQIVTTIEHVYGDNNVVPVAGDSKVEMVLNEWKPEARQPGAGSQFEQELETVKKYGLALGELVTKAGIELPGPATAR